MEAIAEKNNLHFLGNSNTCETFETRNVTGNEFDNNDLSAVGKKVSCDVRNFLVSSSNSLLPPILHQSVIFSHLNNNNNNNIEFKSHCKVDAHMNLNN